LAVVFLAFPAVFGIRSDEQAEQFLNSASAIEEFSKAKGKKSTKNESQSQISPLVKQAQAFASYLNPPKPEKAPATHRTGTPKIIPRPTGPVSPKFKLLGTSYYALHPDLSLALIDEPGKGLRWVRQSSEVSHLIIEQVKNGSVVVRDGKRTFELAAERPKKRSLLKGPSPGATGPKSILPTLGKAGARITSSRPPQPRAKENAASASDKAGARTTSRPPQQWTDLLDERWQGRARTLHEVIRNCKPYQDPGWSIGFSDVTEYVGRGDVPLALVPFVLLANLAGVSTPVTGAIVDIFGSILSTDLWKTGLTLGKLGLDGLTTQEVIRYVTEGEKR